MTIFERWTARETLGADRVVLVEKDGGRESVWADLKGLIRQHFFDASLYQRLGIERLARALSAKLPMTPTARSGDLGELLGTEYVDQETGYSTFIKRLRWKDGRNVALHGDDLIGIADDEGQARVLKGEVKSRASLSSNVVQDALEKLGENGGQPDPHTLTLLYERLTAAGRHDEAKVVIDLLTKGATSQQLFHLVFALSGNNPATALSNHDQGEIERRLVGLWVDDHQEFIRSLFDECLDEL